MINRMTSSQMMASAGRNLQLSVQHLARLQEQASSQKQISRPSDDPSATAAAMHVRGQLSANGQYARNLQDGQGWLATVDAAFTAATTVIGRARDLTLQASNTGALSATAREAIATELEGLREDLLRQANTSYLGRPVFAGTSGAQVAFDPSTYTHTGSGVASDIVERRIGPDTTVRVDADGVSAFGQGADSIFATLDAVAAGIRAGEDVSPRLAQIDEKLTALLGQQALAGTRYGQVERAQEVNVEQQHELKAQRSTIEDIDLAEVLLELKTQELAYQSALAVTSRALQPSLLSFLS